MDLSAFYGVVSGINFTLLGLWWVAVRERPEVGVGTAAGRRMAYLVALQFLIPGTMALLSQVAPDEPGLWRASFTIAGVAGAYGSVLLGRSLTRVPGQALVAGLIRWGSGLLYAAVAVFAAIPGLTAGLTLSALQVEAVLLCLLVFLGVHAAWVVAMVPKET
ncbi:MAG: hypothetical protein HOV71_27445 [Hamadaea sp.]|nr:hypothetical protein [Hamadaea sp.]NUR51878.1 hypothetical protein [Hamadaea sp.]NUT05654.1 hypothetical protein [Hamadaea sp.]